MLAQANKNNGKKHHIPDIHREENYQGVLSFTLSYRINIID